MARIDAQQFARVRNLIALDASNVMKRLNDRKDEMIHLFSRLRDREPLLATIHSWFPSATFEDLSQLDTAQQMAVNGFYEQLEELRWYFRYTDDMPGSALQVLQRHVVLLTRKHEELNTSLGPPSAEPPKPASIAKPRPAKKAAPARKAARKR